MSKNPHEMKIIQSNGWSNITFTDDGIFSKITYRVIAVVTIVLGIILPLAVSPLFRGNILATIGLIALTLILIGTTPTKRSVLKNILNILFSKPVTIAVVDNMTSRTFGHNIRKTIPIVGDAVHVPVSKIGKVRLTFLITSDIDHWSTEEEYQRYYAKMTNFIRTLYPTDSYEIINKVDKDLDIANLAFYLSDHEDYGNDPDLAQMSRHRQLIHHNARSNVGGMFIQQYLVVNTTENNVQNVIAVVSKLGNVVELKQEGLDIMLASEGFELLTQYGDD